MAWRPSIDGSMERDEVYGKPCGELSSFVDMPLGKEVRKCAHTTSTLNKLASFQVLPDDTPALDEIGTTAIMVISTHVT